MKPCIPHLSIDSNNANYSKTQIQTTAFTKYLLRIIIIFLLCMPAFTYALADIDVLFISRFPKYTSYAGNVTYFLDQTACKYPYTFDKGPQLCTGYAKSWPSEGETVNFTVFIKNRGDLATGNFTYRWYINGKEYPGIHGTIRTGETETETIQWNWTGGHSDHSDQTITFVADPKDMIAEISEKNNNVTDYIKGLSFHFFVDESSYFEYSTRQNLGSYSFEDWAQQQVREMNSLFSMAKYNLTLSGILERVRIDNITVVPDGTLPCGGTHATLSNEYDGVWGWDSRQECGAGHKDQWIKWISDHMKKTEYSLIHELSHQLGIIDLYILDTHKEANHVKNKEGQELSSLGIGYVSVNGGMMGGGETFPYNNASFYDVHTAVALNRNLGYRRGFYGDYLFDVPDNNYLRFVDASGKPLENANIAIYQTYLRELDNIPEITGKTQTDGIFPLPNREIQGTTTATNHRLKPNPFGMINVAGTNGVFLIKISKDGQEDFKWFDIMKMNFAYWSGNLSSYVYQINASIVSGYQGNEINIAQNLPSNASRTAFWSSPSMGNDGLKAEDKAWYIDNPTTADWWELNLTRNYTIYKINLFSKQWPERFRIEIDGKKVVNETAWSIARMEDRDYVSYVFKPTSAMTVRIIPLSNQTGMRLNEIEVFSTFPVPETTSTTSTTSTVSTTTTTTSIIVLTEEQKIEKETGDTTGLIFSLSVIAACFVAFFTWKNRKPRYFRA